MRPLCYLRPQGAASGRGCHSKCQSSNVGDLLSCIGPGFSCVAYCPSSHTNTHIVTNTKLSLRHCHVSQCGIVVRPSACTAPCHHHDTGYPRIIFCPRRQGVHSLGCRGCCAPVCTEVFVGNTDAQDRVHGLLGGPVWKFGKFLVEFRRLSTYPSELLTPFSDALTSFSEHLKPFWGALTPPSELLKPLDVLTFFFGAARHENGGTVLSDMKTGFAVRV
jgi:hypothetical protein